ncbi:major facilitator transporter [Limosilactobacillus frumenti DSM 13145]|uniref:Major facilitator transporter n=1 Tax=Limosilactobacillus frumenti DSM 13145 TaxID=1423746 RepID=A0A0R1P4L2_9LACO|nr:MFS transporter [Limosilactobacillus frumenti]KRL27247.1 major facilitator transporter [Limosilactobacillus frumenti DSM 13145]MBA2913418.1 multidrug efflux MFS transporter [Limosilactobacillus frumenti]QFG72700.1 multidrug efflux MFS transporter [Limosilactobacillus frumenti]
MDNHLSAKWHQTFYTLWLGAFITGMGYSMTMPFVSLFINELGNFSHFELNLYSGLAFGATFVSQAAVSPLWGSLADQKGRKLMCMRASGVMACTIFITGLSQTVWMIIGMRFLQGAFSGYINNATAMMAGETPHSKSGWVMSAMTTAGIAGNLVGPLLGGALSGAFGYRIPFFITGGLMLAVFLSTWLLTTEHFTPIQRAAMKPMKEIIAEIPNPHLIFIMFITTMIVTASTMSIDPIISLYVKQLMHDHGNIAFVAGIVAATPGLGTLIAASKVGHTMDRIGPERVLKVGLLTAFILFIPMTFTHSPWSLAFWRFLLGLANAALMPATQTVLTLDVPTEAFGRVFSYNQSFQGIGCVLGSILGSVISGLSSYPMVFAITGLTLLINWLLVMAVRQVKSSTN